jgi:4-amino-4-deoxy-L-arabinose transferase-like glycosyltransferase
VGGAPYLPGPIVGQDRRDAWLVFAVALAVRLVFVLVAYPRVEPDFRTPDGYDTIAANLAAGHGFRLEGSSLAAAERLPLYPAFLAALMRAFGPSPVPWQVAQCVLGALTCVLVFLVARRWASRGGALAASLLCALHPTLVLYTARPLTETLYILLLVLLVHALATERWLAAGGWLGLGLLVKSSALLHLVAFPPLLPRASARSLVRAATIVVLVILPWAAWNLWVHGAPHLLTATAGRNLHQGLFISRRVGWTIPVGDLNREADWALWNDLRQARVAWTGDVTIDDASAGRVAREWIGQHPGVAARLWARNLLLTWYLARTAPSMALHAAMHGVLLLLALIGAVRLLRTPGVRDLAAALVLVVVAYTAAHAVIKPGIRYILPAVPVAAMLAAAALPGRRP